jgi:hypothetical protein
MIAMNTIPASKQAIISEALARKVHRLQRY